MDRRSRYARCFAVTDDEGRQFLSPRDPFEFRKLDDTTTHVVRRGDTLWGLAALHYEPLGDRVNSAALLWWVIADFQPQPIHDPFATLPDGMVLMIPSARVVSERILARGR